jgi:hypothetical protein
MHSFQHAARPPFVDRRCTETESNPHDRTIAATSVPGDASSTIWISDGKPHAESDAVADCRVSRRYSVGS